MSDEQAESGSGRGTLVLAALMVVALVLVGVVGYSLGRLSSIGPSEPTDTSVEASFARDMQVHHDQGVELALIVRDRTRDPAVRLLAYDIATTQAQQSGQLYGWLNEWGLSQAGSEPSMTWMAQPGSPPPSHSGMSGIMSNGMNDELMPGLATRAQIAELTAASGVEAERIFLILMMAHHQGAVEMASAVLERTGRSTVRAFATAIINSQTAEMDLMATMLEERS
ncbi:MAG: DUF305 domain-containing protein [Rhodoglobus sp.]|nr:DUF305 domain-containing protein [Rhodoglobus sp.]